MFKRSFTVFIIALLYMTINTCVSEAQDVTKEQSISKTIRLLFPQWQGGINPSYPLGAKLLAWLAPESDAPLIEVPVRLDDGTELKTENGVAGQSILFKQFKAARNIVDIQRPDRIVVFGGDCHVSQAPFAYLSEKYDGELGILWIDAHPDVSTPEFANNENAMVLGNLLGKGDPLFVAEVKVPVKAENVIYAGLNMKDMPAKEAEAIKRLGLKSVSTEELIENSEPILRWIKEKKIKKLAIHFDLDVIDPQEFRSLLQTNPHGSQEELARYVLGNMSMKQVTRLITDVFKETDPNVGKCQIFSDGQEFIVDDKNYFTMIDGKFCTEAWDAVSRYIYAALQGGSIMQGWNKDEKVMITCCNDGVRPVFFKIERIDE